jgi:DNA repair protein REV1
MGTRLEKHSNDVRKRIESHTFQDEEGEEYEGSKFGGFSDYMRRKKIKLQNLDAEIRSQSADKPHIFRNIVVHVNGYTQPSLNDLHQLVVSHGGGFLQYLDGKTAVTHVVASHLTPKKKVEFAKYRIVKPAWIVDSVNAGKLLPWDAYRVVDEGVTQKVLGFENGSIISQARAQRQGYRDQTDTSWYTAQVRQKTQSSQMPGGNGLGSPRKAPPESSRFGFDERGIPTVLGGDETPKASSSPQKNEALAMADEDDVDSDLESLEEGNGEGELMKMAPVDDVVTRPEPSGDDIERKVKGASSEAKTGEKRKLTAEEHNAILLSNPHMAKSSTANPDFLNQYYRESRLHHLSTWKADLKAQLQARALAKSSSQESQPKRAAGSRRYIMHVDFDSFFAAVSLRKHPHLVDKPVVIAHGSGPGSEIASCNYPARKFGVKNGMWMKTALGLCSDLKVLPYDFQLYEEASRLFYDSILAVDGIVQSISIDEALIDVTDQCIKAGGSDGRAQPEGSIYREQEKIQQIATELRNLIREKTGCEVSVGMGNNILLAKVALRRAKPAGQYLVKPEEMLEFLGGLVVTDLPGIAWSIGKKLEEIGVTYVKDIRELSKERLMTHLGPKTGEKIWDCSRGIHKQEVGEQVVRKSVSAEINWGIRFIDQQQAEDFVQCLCDELSKRLTEQLVKGRQLTMKIMRKAADAGMDPPKNLGHGKCDTFNKSIVLGVATTDKAVIGKEAISILRNYGFPPGELRGLGVQMQKLEPLKAATSSAVSAIDSSQRRLQFKKPTVSPIPEKKIAPSKVSASPAPKRPRSRLTDTGDPIEDNPTPKKDRYKTIEGALPKPGFGEENSDKRPLNVAGTQFILPSQIDTSVLAELPSDIRAKLAPKQKSILDTIVRPVSPQPSLKSRSASPQVSDSELGLPNQSQLDPQILAELPEDVRQELLAHYQGASKMGLSKLRQTVPLSPRKTKPMTSKKLVITPTKRQKFNSIATKGRSKNSNATGSTLTQANFISMSKPANPTDAPPAEEEISQSFLEELPEDIRLEILAEQKRNRMKAKSGLNIGSNRRRPKPGNSTNDAAVMGQQKLVLPPAPTIPTFTSRKLSTLPDLRNAMDAWMDEFSEGDEGPYVEDVEALGRYLERVILEEGDMEKAVGVVKWLGVGLDMRTFMSEILQAKWAQTLRKLREMVQLAVKKKGLPPLAFE